MSNWISSQVCSLTEENMNLLLDFKIPAIVVKNFIPPKICRVVAERLTEIEFGAYDHLDDIPVYHLGVCHNQWAHDDKKVYFSKKEQAQDSIDQIYECLNINPVSQVIDAIKNRTGRPALVFDEPGFGHYFAGAFRSFRGHGKLHVDHAPSHINAPWEVTKIMRQMTWNIYYSMLESGGELVIYDTIHTPSNEQMKVPGEYYFPYEVLERPDKVVIEPQIGDLIIFNTQNFHEILGNNGGGHRISQTSFIGLKPDGSLGLWS